MKKRLCRYPLPGLLLAFTLFSCSKNQQNSGATSSTDVVNTELTTGTWIISSFSQRTEDKTSKFSGTVFIFHPDGTVQALKNSTEVQGTWHHSPAVTYYGSTSKEAMYLNMGTTQPFDLLTKNWNVASTSATIIKLDSPELVEDEHLQFTRQ